MNCIVAYQPKGADDLADSYINLANPGTYNAAPGTAPDWDAVNGWKFNGSTHYLTTGIAINTLNFSCLVIYTNFTTGASGWCLPCGYYTDATDNFTIAAKRGDSTYSNKITMFNAGDAVIDQLPIAQATLGIAGAKAYYNGAEITYLRNTMGTGTNNGTNFYIGADFQGGGALNFFPGYIQAIAIYNIVLTPTQVEAITDEMEAL